MIQRFLSVPGSADPRGRRHVRRLGAWGVLLILAMNSLVAEAITLTAVQSRKVHGTAGTFNVDIDLAQALGGAVTVESRDIGAGHQIVFRFDAAVTSFGTPASVDENGVSIGSLTPQTAGNDVVVGITGVPDNKRVRIVLPAVNGGADAVVSMGFLVGDVNDSRSLSAADTQQIRSRSGQVADANNFRFDLNASGAIGAADIVAVKSRSPRSLPDLGVLPAFTTQPANATITVGQTAQFMAAASGSPAPTLKWQVSTDGGVNWSDIAGANSSPLNIVGALSDSGRRYRAVASNAVGSVITNVAILTVNGVPVPKAWQAATRVSPDIDGDVYNYQIAFGSNGDAMAVWTDLVSAGVGTNSNVWASRYTPGGGWEAATVIESGAFVATDPQVAVDAGGNAIVVWAQSDGLFGSSIIDPLRYNIWSNRYVPGTGWTGETLIETLDGPSTPRSASQPRIAMAANGQAIAIWTQGSASHSGADVWANSFTPGSGWAVASLLSVGTSNAGAAKVAMDAAGNSMAVWSQLVGGTHFNLFASRNFGAPVQIETGTGNPSSVQVASNASGETFVVWGQGCVTWANRFVPASGWGIATALQSGSPACFTIPVNQIAVDDNGNAIAAWVLNTGNITTYGNRYNAGSGWQGASQINFGGLHFQFAMNAAGNVLSAWRSGSILAGNGDFVSGYNFFPSVQVYGGSGLDTTGLRLAIDANGNTIALFKRAEVSGARNTVWAAVFR